MLSPAPVAEPEEEPEEEIEVLGNYPLPSFDPALPAVIQIQKTESAQPWSFKLPPTVDPNEDGDLQVKVNLGPASVFVEFSSEDSTLKISDLSSATVLDGIYESLKVTLSDLQGSQTFEFELHVLPYGQGADEGEASATQLSEDEKKEISDKLAKAKAETSAESTTLTDVAEEPKFKIFKVEAYGEAVIEFTKKMDFPGNMLNLINLQQNKTWENSQLNSTNATVAEDVDMIMELHINTGED